MTEPLPTSSIPARRGLVLGLCLLLAAVVLAVYWPVRGYDFVNFDDNDYVTANPAVLQGLSWNGIVWAFTTGHANNWHPLTWLSLMLDVQLLGKGAAGLHVINLLFHTANTVVLFLFLRCLTGTIWRSALVAALFGLHPLHVESVAWISERKDVLSALFGLLTLWMYVLDVKQAQAGQRACPIFRRLAILFFILGLLGKPMLVTLPFVMLLLDYWPLGRLDSLAEGIRLLREKMVFLVLAVLSCVVTFVVQYTSGAMRTLEQFPVGARVANGFVACALYLQKTFWPFDLACVYVHRGEWPGSAVLGAVALVIILCLAALWLGRANRLILTGWFWFLGMLVPVIGLVQVGVQTMADRYTYLPLIGIFIVLSWGLGNFAGRSGSFKVVAALISLTVIAACAVRSRDQLRNWQNSESLFRHASAVTKNNFIAYNNLGLWLYDQGRTDEAIESYQQALQANPAHVKVLNNLGNAYSRRGDYAKAVDCFEEALRRIPGLFDAHYNLGNTLFKLGRYDEAITNYQAAVRLNSADATIHNNLGLALVMARRPEEAVLQFQSAVRLDAANPKTHFSLGLTLARLGRSSEAAAEFREVLRLQPDYEDARRALDKLGEPPPK